MKFTALYVEPANDNVTANVIFADPETNPDEPAVLMFSRSVEFPDSAYYFEINDQSFGRYGGLQKVRVTRGSLEVQLEPKVVAEFGNEDFATVQVDFEIEDETYQAVLETLKAIFAGSDVLSVE